MRKLFYLIVFAVAASLTITSCTEEEVQPSSESTMAEGGGATDPKRP